MPPMRRAFVRRPTEDLERGERSFVPRTAIDLDRALLQHEALRVALAVAGLEVVELPPLPGAADATFVEDTALLLDGVAVRTRPGAASRRGEGAALFEALGDALPVLELEAPATLDGGDVIVADRDLWVGQSGRTNHAGLKALAHLVLDHGYRVKAAHVTGCLHLKTACTFLGRGALLVNPSWVDTHRLPAPVHVPVHEDEPFGANALAVGGRVLLSASHPRTAERVAAAGFEVVPLELSEFEKAEGGVTCLALLEAEPANGLLDSGA